MKYIKEKIHAMLLPQSYSSIERKKINQAVGDRSIFWGDQASYLKKRLLTDFIRTGQTFPPAGNDLIDEGNKSDDVKKVVSELKDKGYVLIENYISDEICDRVVSYAENTPCWPRPKDHAPPIPVQKINFNGSFSSARYDFSPNILSIFQNKDLQNLLSDPYLLRIANTYLSSPPYLDPIELWWFLTFPVRNGAWAEEYHFDYDSVRWLKFFINFEDIELENGPHCFIEGTHKDFGIPKKLRKRGYVRHSDEDVFKYVDRSKEKIFMAKAGSLLIEDTRGLHKGLTPSKGRRLLFSFQLSNYLFIEQSNLLGRIKPDFEMTDSFLDLFKSRPEFFSRYFL